MAIRLLDTNIVSFQLKSHTLIAAYRPHMIGHVLAVSFQTEAELLAWASLAKWGRARRTRLENLLASYIVLGSNRVSCEKWADIRVARRTQPISTNDAWIAATALAFGLELVTHNPADFANIPGLAIITEAP